MKYHIERTSAGKCHWWKIIASNGQIMAHSEVFTTKAKRDRSSKRVSVASGFPIREAK